MARGGAISKLGKLKCMIKKWHLTSSSSSSTAAAATCSSPLCSKDDRCSPLHEPEAAKVPLGLHPVYVGKSKRRYLVSSELIRHPLFQVLVQSTGNSGPVLSDGAGGTNVVVGCEVVLFEHLLWMLENADPPPESLDELIHFYAC